jgi:hypothetical protein
MYEPLDTSRREVRLLQLIGGSDDSPIQKGNEVPGPDSRFHPPHSDDSFLSSLLFKGGGFLSSKLPVLAPSEQTQNFYVQNGGEKRSTFELMDEIKDDHILAQSTSPTRKLIIAQDLLPKV